MSKELTPLEALSIMHFNCCEYDNLDKHYDIIEKELKALDIIKNKIIFPSKFILFAHKSGYDDEKALYEYNCYVGDEHALNLEEFILLKEVLKDDQDN